MQNLQKQMLVNFENGVKCSDEFCTDFLNDFQQNEKKKYFYRFIKRCFDIVSSFLALIVLIPLFIAVAIAIKIDSKGPVFFVQKRIGKNGKSFTCIKFRSMADDAPHEEATSKLKNPELYITKVGRFLRKTSIDELPQLFCVLLGTMSIIGYRPLILSETNCNELRNKLGVFRLKPGLSGYAQVHGRDNVYYKSKAILDAYYVNNASLWLDFKLIFQSIGVVLSRKGNNAQTIPEKNATPSISYSLAFKSGEEVSATKAEKEQDKAVL